MTEELTPQISLSRIARAVSLLACLFAFLNCAAPPAVQSPPHVDANDPNPFSPTSTITYSVTDSCHVVVVLFDVQGRVVDTLVNALQAPGKYHVEADPSGKLEPGVYFYWLSCGDISATKKLVIVK